MFHLFMRIYQKVLFLSSFILPWREPEILSGEDAEAKLVKLFTKNAWKSVLFVTGPNIHRRGIPVPLIEKLEASGVKVILFNQTEANPPISQVEICVKLFHEHRCDALIGFGGGSPMDLAKATAARIARPKKSIPKLKGVLKVLKKTPPLIAVPTTAGSGSETTLAAVITDSNKHEKYAINDPSLIPSYALLNPEYTLKMPPRVTADTGLDALTHALEAYVGQSNTRYTRKKAENAIRLILKFLPIAYQDGNNLEARHMMQIAAYDAGCAFTRAYVGYVHALSHAVSAFYGTAHGFANAVLLPYVLKAYGPSVHRSLARLARQNGLATKDQTDAEAAHALIQQIEKLNHTMQIPNHLKELRKEDIPALVDHADAEANPLYPVPRIFNKEKLSEIYQSVKGNTNDTEV